MLSNKIAKRWHGDESDKRIEPRDRRYSCLKSISSACKQLPQYCNVFGTRECSEDQCVCKEEYSGQHCEYCSSHLEVLLGESGIMNETTGEGVWCSLFFHK